EAFPEMPRAIANAKSTIIMESYIFAQDNTGSRFLGALRDAAKRGVDVRLIVDGVGSYTTDPRFFSSLRDAGGEAHFFRPLRSFFRFQNLWKRDHRKLLVVDEHIAFTGGLNVADVWAPIEWDGDCWHDTHVEVRGPAARDLTKIFNRTWYKITGIRAALSTALSEEAGDIGVQVLESRLTRRYSIRRAYLKAIRRSRKVVCITNAYAIPDMDIRRAIRNACKRGVKVQLLLAGPTDLKSVQYASRALYSMMMRWGVEIYEWNDRVLHAKTAVIDGEWCSIGSYNMDRRSFVNNLEANIFIVDPALGAALDNNFQKDISQSKRVDAALWHRRSALQKILEQVFLRLRYFL
ncbi:cardiolipin synthase B, partial [Myxococcota bacterium]|nr:cardiolipin synthase B [Myxococcota bacterium]